LILSAAALLLSAPTFAASNGLDTQAIEKLTGAKGKLDEKVGAFKVSVPRSDLSITIQGVKMTPPLGLTSWAAFQGAGDHVMVMGDMVVLENQVNPVMSVALDNGLDVTALHNHFFGDSPKVMFMHISGMGSQEKLAGAVGKVFAQIAQPGVQATAGRPIDPAKTDLDPAKFDALFGVKGDFGNGVYKATIGREIKMHGMSAGATMGVNTWAAFAGSEDRAVVDGDFAVLETELQPVLKSLRSANIDIVAIHQHMTQEQPRMMFLHYWGIGRASDLAQAVKGALAKTAG
jgi:hypothetical protein